MEKREAAMMFADSFKESNPLYREINQDKLEQYYRLASDLMSGESIGPVALRDASTMFQYAQTIQQYVPSLNLTMMIDALNHHAINMHIKNPPNFAAKVR